MKKILCMLTVIIGLLAAFSVRDWRVKVSKSFSHTNASFNVSGKNQRVESIDIFENKFIDEMPRFQYRRIGNLPYSFEKMDFRDETLTRYYDDNGNGQVTLVYVQYFYRDTRTRMLVPGNFIWLPVNESNQKYQNEFERIQMLFH